MLSGNTVNCWRYKYCNKNGEKSPAATGYSNVDKTLNYGMSLLGVKTNQPYAFSAYNCIFTFLTMQSDGPENLQNELITTLKNLGAIYFKMKKEKISTGETYEHLEDLLLLYHLPLSEILFDAYMDRLLSPKQSNAPRAVK